MSKYSRLEGLSKSKKALAVVAAFAATFVPMYALQYFSDRGNDIKSLSINEVESERIAEISPKDSKFAECVENKRVRLYVLNGSKASEEQKRVLGENLEAIKSKGSYIDCAQNIDACIDANITSVPTIEKSEPLGYCFGEGAGSKAFSCAYSDPFHRSKIMTLDEIKTFVGCD